MQPRRSVVARRGSAFGSGLIEFICRSHEADEQGPTIAPLYGRWSYCRGFQRRQHDWYQIEPTSRDRLERHVLPKAKGASATSQRDASHTT